MEKPSGLNKIRTAIGAIAALGAVSGTELPKDGGLPQMQQAEAAEAFDANLEAEAFLDRIMSLKVGNKFRERTLNDVWAVKAAVEEELDVFTLALQQQRTAFTVRGSRVFMGGTISPKDRLKAARLLQSKFESRTRGEDDPLSWLQIDLDNTLRNAAQIEALPK